MFNVYFPLNYGLFSMLCIDLIFQAIVKENEFTVQCKVHTEKDLSICLPFSKIEQLKTCGSIMTSDSSDYRQIILYNNEEFIFRDVSHLLWTPVVAGGVFVRKEP